MPPWIMRDYLEQLRRTGGVAETGLVATAVLFLTSLVFFRVALLPELGAELSMSTFQLGAVTTIFALGRLVADLPGGYFADRVAPRGMLTLSAAGVGVASLMMGLSAGMVTFYVAALLLGLSSATTNATGMTYFSNAAGIGLRGTSMAVYSAGLLGGQALGPAVAGLIAAAFGWRPAMFLAAGVAVVVSVSLVLSGGRGVLAPASGKLAADNGGVAAGRSSMLMLRAVSFVVFLALGSVPQTLVPVMGSETLGLGTASIGLALGLGGVSRFIGTLVGGRLSDRVSRKAALVPGLLGQAGGVALLALSPSVAVWLAAIVVMSLASFAVSVAATVVGDLAPASRVGTQLGRFRFFGDLGLVAGPVTVTAVYQTAGRPAAFLVVAAALATVALACLRFLPETHSGG